MRAIVRCKAHSQGDKCRQGLGHQGEHVGQFTRWDKQSRTELFKRRSAKRNKWHERVVRDAANTDANAVHHMRAEERAWALKQLSKAMQYLRGHGS